MISENVVSMLLSLYLMIRISNMRRFEPEIKNMISLGNWVKTFSFIEKVSNILPHEYRYGIHLKHTG